MDKEVLYQTIFKRRSVRKIASEPLDEATLSKIRDFIADIRPMIPGIRTEIKLIGSSEVKGMLRNGGPHSAAFFSEPKEGHLINAGFMLQQLDLYLSAIGIGNCYQGMAKMSKEVEGPNGTEFVIAMSFGMPKEEPHRKSVSEFKRLPLEKISSVTGWDGILECARLAPSGVNNQSWYFTGGDGRIFAYYEKSLITNSMNKINVGIALCHIWLAAEHSGRKIDITFDGAPGQQDPRGHSYAATVLMGG